MGSGITDEDYQAISEEANRMYRKWRNQISGQMVTMYDNPTYYIMVATRRHFNLIEIEEKGEKRNGQRKMLLRV